MAVVPTAEAGMRASARATIIQLRSPGATTRELEREAIKLVHASPAPVVVSSRCDVAVAAAAAGVNLPESDIATELARGLIRSGLVGRSVHSLSTAEQAQDEGADYVIFGPVWPSASHPGAAAQGVEALARVARTLRIPVLAIGGVTDARIAEAHRAGASGYAAIALFA